MFTEWGYLQRKIPFTGGSEEDTFSLTLLLLFLPDLLTPSHSSLSLPPLSPSPPPSLSLSPLLLQSLSLLFCIHLSLLSNRLVGLVVKASASSACAEIFPGSSHTSDFKIGTPVATLPGAWR